MKDLGIFRDVLEKSLEVLCRLRKMSGGLLLCLLPLLIALTLWGPLQPWDGYYLSGRPLSLGLWANSQHGCTCTPPMNLSAATRLPINRAGAPGFPWRGQPAQVSLTSGQLSLGNLLRLSSHRAMRQLREIWGAGRRSSGGGARAPPHLCPVAVGQAGE